MESLFTSVAFRFAKASALVLIGCLGLSQATLAQPAQVLDQTYNFATPRSQSYTLPVPSSQGGGFAMVIGNGGNSISPINFYDDSTWFVRLNAQGVKTSEVLLTNFLGYGFQVSKMLDWGGGYTLIGTLGTTTSIDDRACVLKIDYNGATVASYIAPADQALGYGDQLPSGSYAYVYTTPDGSLGYKRLNGNLVLQDSALVASGPTSFDFAIPISATAAPNGGLLASVLSIVGQAFTTELMRFSEEGNLIWTKTLDDTLGFPLKMQYGPNSSGSTIITLALQGQNRFARLDTAGNLISGQPSGDASGLNFATYDFFVYSTTPIEYIACGFSQENDPNTIGAWIARMDEFGVIDTASLFQEVIPNRQTLLRNVFPMAGGFGAGGSRGCLFDQATSELTAGRPWLLTYANSMGFSNLTSKSENISGLALYPNPSAQGNGNVTLKREMANTQATTIRVIDATGRVAASSAWPAGSQNTTISTNSLAPGVYAVQVGEMVTKLVIE